MIIGTLVGQTPVTSMKANCAKYGVNFRTVKKAMNDIESIESYGFLYKMQRPTVLTKK